MQTSNLLAEVLPQRGRDYRTARGPAAGNSTPLPTTETIGPLLIRYSQKGHAENERCVDTREMRTRKPLFALRDRLTRFSGQV
jgi:hypothetical protein